MQEEKDTTVTVSFVADEEIRDWLDQERARQHGRSRSSLMREIIEFYQKYRNLPETLLEEARSKLGLAGNGC